MIIGHDIAKIANLKIGLSKSFVIKDFRLYKQILGTFIRCDRATKNYGYHKRSIEKVLENFNIKNAKLI